MNNYKYIKEIIKDYTSAELAMQDAYISLLALGENISVRTIVEEAKIERSTFYAFYERAEEIADQVENRIVSEILEDDSESLKEYLETVFSVFAENKREINVLMTLANSYSLYQKMINAAKYYLSNSITEHSLDNEILLDVLSSAIINPFISYIEEERDVDLGYLEDLIEKLLAKGDN